MLACGLILPDPQQPARPKFTAEDLRNLYLERGGEIFDVPLWKKISSLGGISDEKYPERPFERILEEYFGDCRLSELMRPLLVSSYDVQRSVPYFFKQHKANKYGEINRDADFLVRDVARATTAAPTYFEAAHIRSLSNESFPLLDGGVFINNPALSAYAEARQIQFERYGRGRINCPTAKDMVLVSLGTGSSSDSYTHDDVKNWGSIQWIRPLINIMMNGVSQTVDFQLKQLFKAVEKPDQYVRLEPRLQHASLAMDCATEENH
ncbi:MAG: patatin-like phospholipase family protein [Cyclobacteriaceae bacterium]